MFHFFGFGIILQLLAIVHFIRRRPDTYWLWIILIGGGLGALVYLAVEAAPDLALVRSSFRVFPRRKRIRELQTIILDNPAPGNYEELADLYREEGQPQAARDAYSKAITPRTGTAHNYYGRALSSLGLNDYAAAAQDLEKVVAMDRQHDYGRALGLLAFALAHTGDAQRAALTFEEATRTSTLSEVQYHYACFLSEQGRRDEARQWAERLLAKKATLPRYLQRRERPWFRKASAFLKQLPPKAATATG